ncbi:hypothetical protein AO258_22570 [Pseudomonas syringae ICMP 19498]|uniref:hypothetical protein n=1 Tax=Pseudomonas syringae TaxID=317 RepID=UPI00073100BB|nr:hypothetical protein [Pseudomonas syringae]KTC54982.1 hypothetical protein AO258_22570 [Pseudomonas syringae ICMP 19498]
MSTIDAFLEHLERRLNIHVVQQILREAELLSARSWSELKAIVKGAVKANPSLIDRLQAALVMQQLCDLKAIAFYEVPASAAIQIALSLKTKKRAASPLTDAFPIDVNSSILEKDDGKLKVVHRFSDNFGCGIVLSRRRRFSVNNEHARSSLSPALQKQFPNADKIIEVTYLNKQTYDVVYLNQKNNILEVRADCTRETGQQQTAGQLTRSVDDLRAYASGFVSKSVAGYNLGHPINLLPLTRKVYADGSGAIKKIGFATEEESVKRETMRAGVDLRSELFHKTGAKAIDHKMSIFEIAIQWHGTDVNGGISGSKPEIFIPGNYRDYVKVGARTDILFAKGVRTYADSNFILEKLKSYK